MCPRINEELACWHAHAPILASPAITSRHAYVTTASAGCIACPCPSCSPCGRHRSAEPGSASARLRSLAVTGYGRRVTTRQRERPSNGNGQVRAVEQSFRFPCLVFIHQSELALGLTQGTVRGRTALCNRRVRHARSVLCLTWAVRCGTASRPRVSAPRGWPTSFRQGWHGPRVSPSAWAHA
jgi:hypothetical protein